MLSKFFLLFQITPLRRKLLFFGLSLSVYSYFLFRFSPKHARFGDSNTHLKPEKPDFIAIILGVRFVIKVLTKYIPWEFMCRHQAWLASVLLKKYQVPYTVFVGFKKNNEGKIEGHAWTIAQNIMVSGFCDPKEYTVQTTYMG
ncbi:lasso peptide biosynthesis B2 protein [Aquirufa sp. ROCK2-A2]